MSLPDDQSCRELVALVTEYLEGAMTPPERARFEGHLAICDGCVAHLDQMRRTIRLTGRLSEESLTPEARSAFLATFRGWKAARGKSA